MAVDEEAMLAEEEDDEKAKSVLAEEERFGELVVTIDTAVVKTVVPPTEDV